MPSPMSLGTSIWISNNRSLLSLTTLQAEYASLADHFDAVPWDQLSEHCQETVDHISDYIQSRVNSLVFPGEAKTTSPTIATAASSARGKPQQPPPAHDKGPLSIGLNNSKFAQPISKPEKTATFANTWAAAASRSLETPATARSKAPHDKAVPQSANTTKSPKRRSDLRIMIRLERLSSLQGHHKLVGFTGKGSSRERVCQGHQDRAYCALGACSSPSRQCK